MSGNNKKIWLIAIVLFVVLIVAALYGSSRPSSVVQPGVAPAAPSVTTPVTPPPSENPAANGSMSLPISKDNPNVQVILDRPDSIRYLFAGIIKELKNESAGTRVIFVEHSPALPALVLAKDTAVKKVISPGKFEDASLNDLKPGFNADLGVDYIKATKQWFPSVKEVYFNPAP